MPDLSFMIVAQDRKFDEALASSPEVKSCVRLERLEDLAEAVATSRPDALLVSLEIAPEAVFDALEKLLEPRPPLLFYGPDDSRIILRAMRLGAYEYVASGLDESGQLLAAVHRAARDAAASKVVPECALVAVMGAKGGVGATFTSCQLGAALARYGARTALVDGNLRFGDVALYLDLAPKYDFASLAARSETIDLTYLHAALVSHSSGLSVLAAPKDPEEGDAVGPECVENVLGLMRSEFDWVIWDTPYDVDDRSLRVLDHADLALLVTTPDVPALSHARRQLELLARLGRKDDGIRVVLSRTHSSAAISPRDAEDFLRRSVDVAIPDDHPRASVCMNEGRAIGELAARAPISLAVGELMFLAHTWCGRSAPKRPRRRLIDRLRGR